MAGEAARDWVMSLVREAIALTKQAMDDGFADPGILASVLTVTMTGNLVSKLDDLVDELAGIRQSLALSPWGPDAGRLEAARELAAQVQVFRSHSGAIVHNNLENQTKIADLVDLLVHDDGGDELGREEE